MKDLRAIGERKAIELIQKQLETMSGMPVPFGDDVAAYPISRNRVAVLKTDMLVAETDVPPGMTLRQAARKAIVMNISDFAAKGVRPQALLVSLGLTNEMTERDVMEIGKGLNEGAREYGAYFIGGDTGEASSLVVSVALYGVAEKRGLMLRSGAKPRDILAITGCFGKQASGLRILKGHGIASVEIRGALVDSVLFPHARLSEGLALRRSGAVSSSIDSSDGLAWSLHEIANASNVGFRLDKTPIATEAEKYAKQNHADVAELVLHGGEEYELVVTVRPSLWEKAEKAVKRVGGCLIPIGLVTADKRMVLNADGAECLIDPRGYEHFRVPRS
jgi:thiamine-monophosphate kinase